MKEIFIGEDYRLFYEDNGCLDDSSLIAILTKQAAKPSLNAFRNEIVIDMHLKYDYDSDSDSKIKDFINRISQCLLNGLYIDKGDGNRQKFLDDYKVRNNGGFCEIVLKICQEVFK